MGVRGLGGFVEGQLAVDGVEVGNRAARLHRGRVHARVHDLLGDDDVGAREDGLGFGLVANFPVEDAVVRPALDLVADHGGIGVEGLPGVDDRGQDVVFDVDQFQRVAGGVAVLGHDERDLLALEADLVGHEDRLDVRGEGGGPRELESEQVLAGDDGEDLGVGEGVGGVDGDQPGVRHGGTQDGAVQHAGQDDVVQVVALAADKARIFLPLDPAEADRAVLVAGRRIAGPFVDDGHAFTSASCVSAGMSSITVSVPSMTSSTVASLSPPAGWAAAHCTDRTIVA